MDLTAFHRLMLERCGIAFPDEKAALLQAGVEKRMAIRKEHSPAEYFDSVRTDKEGFDRLVDLVTVNETYFFREPAHLRLLAERIAPELLERRREVPLHVLSAGCSTGEEPYSIAIALAGKLGWTGYHRFRVTGVDIDRTALARAREAVYGRNAFRGEGWHCSDWMERSFEACGSDQYQVRSSIRERVEFAQVNLLTGDFPPSLSPPDVIFYRNVSLYFPPDIKRTIFSRLADLLSPGGTLFLGSSETLFHDLGILALDPVDGAFVFRKVPNGKNGGPPIGTQRRGGAATPEVGRKSAESRLLNRAAPRPATPPRRPDSGTRARPTAGMDSGAYDRALAFAKGEQFEKALAELRTVAAADPGFVKAQTLKGCVLLNAGRLAAAREACLAALAVDAFCREAFLLLGIVAKHESQEEEAIRRFREALYVDPSCWLAHFYLAEVHASRKEQERACQEYGVTIRLLEKGRIADHGLSYFPHAFGAEHFVTLCRHASARLSCLPATGEGGKHGV